MSNEQFGKQRSMPSSPSSSRRAKLPTDEVSSSSPPVRHIAKAFNSHNPLTANYLADLRDNRVQRPSGARPPPTSTPRASHDGRASETATDAVDERVPRSESVVSHRRVQSAMSNYSLAARTGRALVQQHHPSIAMKATADEVPRRPLKPGEVVPTSTYMERGMRWMEKEEAVALRDALADMDIRAEQEDEARIHAAAQAEASELVFQHQNPGAILPEGTPYRYKEHLRKNSYAHARTQSVASHPEDVVPTGLARDYPRSVSVGSSTSGEMLSKSRVSSGSSGLSKTDPVFSSRENLDDEPSALPTIPTIHKKPYGGPGKSAAASSRRRSSGRRNISGEIAGTFTGEQIWEEPEEPKLTGSQANEPEERAVPVPLKPRSPFNRAPRKSVDQPGSLPWLQKKRLSTSELHQNPPSQSRNPAYTANPPPVPAKDDKAPPVPMKDGKEIRSDEIRQATSKSIRDRSPKLPTPAVVSDRPGRPIVSFDANWKPKEADVKPAARPRGHQLESQHGARGGDDRNSLPSLPARQEVPSINISAVQLPDPPVSRVNGTASAPPVPTIPTIVCPDDDAPSDNSPNVPSISVSEPTTPVPTIYVPNEKATTRPPPIISVSDNPATNSRPLPDPKTASRKRNSFQRHGPRSSLSTPHWSPAAPAGSRATATCHQCALPIEGRIISLAGLTERFHPHCFACYTCGTSLEALEISPEPEADRAARLDRIHRRRLGQLSPDEEAEGETEAEDGDERLRFYCHLDWHELFAPRCKHCTTPIIGEHAVALGHHWHYGHFFCAECGDPFESGMTHVERDGYAWCLKCEVRRTERRAPKCRKCRGAVVGSYVDALGGEWHEECFRCVDCEGGFANGEIFPRMVDDDGGRGQGEIVAVCRRCMERELKA